MSQLVDSETVLRRIKETVHRIVPDADVILYGSRARGDARVDSDWNLVILTDEEHARHSDNRISDALYDLELETGTVIVAFTYSQTEWDSPRRRVTPFYQTVSEEGIWL